MLGIVEGCKAFEGVLLGMDVTIHTDHLNLLCKKLPSQRLIRWRLLLEEFHPKFVHVAGKDNDAADALSRLDITPKRFDEITWEKEKPRMRCVTDKATAKEMVTRNDQRRNPLWETA